MGPFSSNGLKNPWKVVRLYAGQSAKIADGVKQRALHFFRGAFGRGETLKGIAGVTPIVRWYMLVCPEKDCENTGRGTKG